MKSRRHRWGRPAAVLLTCILVASGCGNVELSGGGGEDGARVPDRVTLVVPFSEGGGTDTWARFVAPYLEQHVEGAPSVQVQNVPGGESITGTNQFVAEDTGDGSQLLVTSGTTYFQWLLGREEVQFDFTTLDPLILNGTGGAIYASAASGITSVADLQQPPNPLVYGGISATGLDLSALLAFELLELDVDATFGFEGRGPARLALERGEVNLDYQTTSAYQTQVEPLVESGKAVPLMSFGTLDDAGEVQRDPVLSDLPTVPEVYEQFHGEPPAGPAMDAYVAFLAAGYVYQKGLWVTPETPEEVRQAFIDAAGEIAADPEFEEKSGEVLGGYPLYPGDEVADGIKQAFDISDDVRGYVEELLTTKYDAEL